MPGAEESQNFCKIKQNKSFFGPKLPSGAFLKGQQKFSHSL